MEAASATPTSLGRRPAVLVEVSGSAKLERSLSRARRLRPWKKHRCVICSCAAESNHTIVTRMVMGRSMPPFLKCVMKDEGKEVQLWLSFDCNIGPWQVLSSLQVDTRRLSVENPAAYKNVLSLWWCDRARQRLCGSFPKYSSSLRPSAENWPCELVGH